MNEVKRETKPFFCFYYHHHAETVRKPSFVFPLRKTDAPLSWNETFPPLGHQEERHGGRHQYCVTPTEVSGRFVDLVECFSSLKTLLFLSLPLKSAKTSARKVHFRYRTEKSGFFAEIL